MERRGSFDFGRLWKQHQQQHKAKPDQFVSVTGGVKKRLLQNLHARRSSRLTVFDNIRNLGKCESPVTLTLDKNSKVEHRKLQLEKWKKEKEKKRKEAAAHKKKPFLVGAAPSKTLPPPPPPPPRVVPSTSGRVTRSQTSKIRKQRADTQTKTTQSFAPKNASFQAPIIKNLTVLPSLAPVAKKSNKTNYIFNPIIPSKPNTKQNRSKTLNNNVIESRQTRNTKKFNDTKSNIKVNKRSPKKRMLIEPSSSSEVDSSKSSSSSREIHMTSSTESQKALQTSSSSEVEMGSKEMSPVFVVNKTPRKSLPKATKLVTPKNPIPKSESSSEEKLRSPKSPVELPMTLEQIATSAKKISPCVTMSRGKDNARREIKQKMEEGLLDEDASDIDSVYHFRRQLASETKRMTEMCEVWDKILEQTVLPESIQELILGAVGQARLLMTQKMRQFATLVERCARPDRSAALVTPADLAGFWDMLFMQVENIDMRFKKLEELQKCGWVEDKPVQAKKKVATKNNAKKVTKPTGGTSRLREMIAAARKAKQQDGTVSETATAVEENKTFEAGFFRVQSPVRSPAQSHAQSPAQSSDQSSDQSSEQSSEQSPVTVLRTPAGKNTLLKAVLSSEAKKSACMNSSFAMLRASVFSKNIDYEGVSLLPQTPINLNATPSRSILKSASATKKKSSKKSIKVVLFDDNDIQERSDCSEEQFKGFETLPEHGGLSSTEKESNNTNDKENIIKRSPLVRQDAVMYEEYSGVMTRNRRKSENTPKNYVIDYLNEITPIRSSRRKKALQEVDCNVTEQTVETPRRSARTRKSVATSCR